MAKRVSLKGKGADLFFGDGPPANETDADRETARTALVADATPDPADTDATTQDSTTSPARPATRPTSRSTTPRQTSTSTLARKQASTKTITQEQPDSFDDEVIAAIRRTIRTPGREVAYVRLSAEEKARLGEIVYTYKRQGRKITETDLSRIAVNALLADYDEHGEASTLARVLSSLYD